MSYLGNTPTTQSFIAGTDYFNGNGSTTAFTLSRPVVSVNDIQAVVNNVVQVPNDAYNVSGNTITFTSAPSSGTGNVYVRYLSTTTQSITPSQNTVSYATWDNDLRSETFAFKNRLINGAMMIDQRNAGASQTINNTTAYTVDRWYVGFTGGSGTSQRVSGTGGFQNAIRMTGGSGVTAAFVGQKIESFNSADLAGNTVTVSFRASSSTLTSIAWYARFPTAVDNYASVTAISNATINITSTPTNYTFSFACPSGVTNGLEIFFLTGSFTSGTLDITGVQLEKGSTATSFDYRPYGTELALCQRYYSKSYLQTEAPGTAGSVGSIGRFVDAVSSYAAIQIFFPQYMRTTPTVTAYNPSTGTINQIRTDTQNLSAAVSAPCPVGCFIHVSNQAVAYTSDSTRVNFTASAEL